MGNNSDIIKIGFDYEAGLKEFQNKVGKVYDDISQDGKHIVISFNVNDKNLMSEIRDLQNKELKNLTVDLTLNDKSFKTQVADIEAVIKIVRTSIGLLQNSADQFQIFDAVKVISDLSNVGKALDGLKEKVDNVITRRYDDSALSLDSSSYQKLQKQIDDARENILVLEKEFGNIYDNVELVSKKFSNSWSSLIEFIGTINTRITATDTAIANISLTVDTLQKILDGTDGNGKNLVGLNSNDLNNFITSLGNIEDYLNQIKKVLVDVGDGSEFSPLLNQINQITVAIKDLSKIVSKNKFNINITSNNSDEAGIAKVEQRKVELLNAYKKQFDAMSSINASGSTIISSMSRAKASGGLIASLTKEIKSFNELDFDNIDQKISAYEDIIAKMIKLSSLSYGENIYANMDSQYQKDIIKAKSNKTRAIKALGKNVNNKEDLGLDNLFSGTDLTEVNRKLNSIVETLRDLNQAISKTNLSNIDFASIQDNLTGISTEIKNLADAINNLQSILSAGVDFSSVQNLRDLLQKIKDPGSVDLAIKNIEDLIANLKEVNGIGSNEFNNLYGEKIKDFGSRLNDDNDLFSIGDYNTKSRELIDNFKKIQNAIKQTSETISKFNLSGNTQLGQDIDNLKQQLLSGSITVTQYNKSVKKLVDTFSSSQKAIEDFDTAMSKFGSAGNNGFFNKYKNDIDKLKEQLQSGAISVSKFKSETNKLFKSYTNSTFKDLISDLKEYQKIGTSLFKGDFNSKDYKDLLLEYNNLYKKFKDYDFVNNPDNLSTDQLDTLKKKLEEVNEALKKIQDNYKNVFDSSKIASQIKQFEAVPETSRTKAYTDALDGLKKAYEELGKIDPNSLDQKNAWVEAKEKCDNYVATLKELNKVEQNSSQWTRDKLLNKISQYKEYNSLLPKSALNELDTFERRLNYFGADANVSEIGDEFTKFSTRMREAGYEGKNLLSVIKDKAWYSFAGAISAYVGLNEFIDLVREASETVIELNTNITDLAKVSEASVSEIYDDFSSYASIAKDLGATISDTITATADWSKNGYSIPDAKELAEASLIYKNVGDNIDIEEANASLISTLQGFQMQADEAMHIVDVFNEVANRESIDSSGIGKALQRSAASFNAASASLEGSVALIAAANTVIQDPERVGV